MPNVVRPDPGDEVDPELLEAARPAGSGRRPPRRSSGTAASIEQGRTRWGDSHVRPELGREDDAPRAVRAADELRSMRRPRSISIRSPSVSGSRPARSYAGSCPYIQPTAHGAPLELAARTPPLHPRGRCSGRRGWALVRGCDDDRAARAGRRHRFAVRPPWPSGRGDRPSDHHAVRRPNRRAGCHRGRVRANDRRRRPGLVTVVGAPGVGKSRLVAESSRGSPTEQILRSRCFPYGDGITYWPIRDLLLAASGISPATPPLTPLPSSRTVVAVGRTRAELVRDRVAGRRRTE